MTGGGALVKASDETIERALDLAARELEVSRADVEWRAGAARVIGAAERSLDLAALASVAARTASRPSRNPRPPLGAGEGETDCCSPSPSQWERGWG